MCVSHVPSMKTFLLFLFLLMPLTSSNLFILAQNHENQHHRSRVWSTHAATGVARCASGWGQSNARRMIYSLRGFLVGLVNG